MVDSPQDGTWEVETKDGVFQYIQWRYAQARFDDTTASPWARLYVWVGGGLDWGYRQFVRCRADVAGAGTPGSARQR